MVLLMCALASGAEVVVGGDQGDLRAYDIDGSRLTPGEFAERVGDQETLALYTYRYRRMKRGAAMIGVGGVAAGNAMLFGGLSLGFVAERYAAGAALGLAGVALVPVSLGVATSVYLSGRGRVNDMDVWYTPEEAQEWLDQAASEGGPLAAGLQVVQGPSGYEIHQGRTPVSTLTFAGMTGDRRTYARCLAARTGLLVAGVAAIAGSWGLFLGSMDNSTPRATRRNLFYLSVAAGLTGSGALVARGAMNQPRVWYAEDDVRAQLEELPGSARAPAPRDVHVGFSPSLVPLDDRMLPGAAVAVVW